MPRRHKHSVPIAAPDAADPLARRIAALASPCHGIVSRDELLTLGMSPSQIQRWVQCGRLHRIHPRAYAVGHSALSFDGLVMAAQKSVGGDATAAARCAALLLGFYDRGRPLVELVSTRRHRGLDDVALRFTRNLPDGDVVRLGPLRVTTVARTIVDLAEYLTSHQVASAIHEARRLRLVRLDVIQRIADMHMTRHGMPVLRRALELHRGGSAGTRSPAEDEFLLMLLDAGVPEPCVNVHVHVGRRKYELDFAWPEIRLNIEVDGGEHDLPSRKLKDEQRDERLQAAGWTVVRIPPSFLDAGLDIALARVPH